jgi:hypothetical protein
VKKIKLPKPSSYPKRIYFADECYSIKFKKKLDCYGKTCATKKAIIIKQGMSHRETLATFIHELLHLIEFEAPMKIKHKTVYKLEKAITEILLDNFL